MKILETRVYRGPNFWSYRPSINMTVDLEELEQYPSSKIESFTERLLALIPSLQTHGCSYGEPGGFVRRLRDGTWMGHIMEHVALELQGLAGTPASQGKTRGAGREGVYHVVYEYCDEQVGLAAGHLALRVVRFLLPPELPSALPNEERASFDFTQELERLAALANQVALGPSTAALVRAAEQRNIPWIRLNDRNLIQLGHGKYQRRIEATVTTQSSHIAVGIAQDKQLTAQLLGDAGLPVPRQRIVSSEEGVREALEELSLPLVVKPLDASHGRGVSLNLSSVEEVLEAFQAAQRYSDDVIIEEFLQGNDYRILVVNGQVLAAAQRVPGHVVGDGVHSIRELVDLVNSDPRRGVGHEKVLTRIAIDQQAQRLLRQAGYTEETVLPEGQIVYLRSTGNLSTGGTARDVTDELCYENQELARRAAAVVGLDIAGIDLITPDISRPVSEVGGGIVEVNAAPGFRMHVAPSEGKPRDVAGPVIDMLFPPGTPTRIPLAAITGTNGKTTTTRMVAHILKLAGYSVGYTTTDGIYVNEEAILRGDMTGPWSARVILRHPSVDAAVLETARGGILREGLGYDEVDVGALLNISSDHLGLRGVETLEDLAKVKSLVIEVVKRGGYAVLNADDEYVCAMAEETRGEIIWFSLNPENDLVREHVAGGGKAVVLEQGLHGEMLVLYNRRRHIPVLWNHEIPATLEGKARFNVANAMAAVAIAHGLGVNIENIRQGLRSFTTSAAQTPGRLNVYEKHPFRVVVDYAHNPAAMRAMADLVQRLRRDGRAIAVLSAPGDRRDQDIRELGEIAGAAFDELILKEDYYLRGRADGAIAELLRQGALAAGMDQARIRYTRWEHDAVPLALASARPGDTVVLFADKPEAVWKQVVEWGQEQQAPPPERAVGQAIRAQPSAPAASAAPPRRRQRLRADRGTTHDD